MFGRNHLIRGRRLALAGSVAFSLLGARLPASSHREAPFITEHPKVDATDFYLFRSYEAGREAFVTIVANYLPLQDPYGGPNYFALDPEALYEIHIDQNADAVEDLTFQFQFKNELKDIALNIGGKQISIPLINAGPIAADGSGPLNVVETYSVTLVRGDRRTGSRSTVTNANGGGSTFTKPVDNIGRKSLPDYDGYAGNFIYAINIPGCDTPGRMFVGQRKDPFVVNLGETFDLVNLNPLGPEDGEVDTLSDKNITSLILELPISCLTTAASPIIGGWTTASLRQGRALNPSPSFALPGKAAAVEGGAWTQVSRLASPLVNEVVIGLKDKDRFNASEPKDDGQFADYVTHPTLPALLNLLFGVQAPPVPRGDLVLAFLTGVPGLNQPPGVTPSEMLRLNTSIAAVAKGAQKRLGVIDGDTAGFPNGRRPGDDVVDIELRVVMGKLVPGHADGQLAYTDGAILSDIMIDDKFPYLRSPLPGSPN